MFSCLVFWPSPVIPSHPQSSPVMASWQPRGWRAFPEVTGDLQLGNLTYLTPGTWKHHGLHLRSSAVQNCWNLYILYYTIYIYIFRGKNLGDSAYLYWIKLDQNTNYCNHKHIHDASYDWVLGIKVGGTGYWVLGHLGLYKHTLLGALQHVYII